MVMLLHIFLTIFPGNDKTTGRLIVLYCVSMLIMAVTLVLVSIWALLTYWRYAKLKSMRVCSESNKTQS